MQVEEEMGASGGAFVKDAGRRPVGRSDGLDACSMYGVVFTVG